MKYFPLVRFLKKLAVPKQILFWPILKKKSRGRKNFVSVLGKIKNKMVIVIMRGMMMMMIVMIVGDIGDVGDDDVMD